MQINLPFSLTEPDRLKIRSNKQFGLTLLNKDLHHTDRRTFYFNSIDWTVNDTIVTANFGTGYVSYNNQPIEKTEIYGIGVTFVNQ